MRLGTCLLASLLAITAVPSMAQEDPAVAAAKEVTTIISKVMANYETAKSYQGTWQYNVQVGKVSQRASVDVKARGGDRLFFHLVAPTGQKTPDGYDPIPEMLVVLDGQTAWFESGGQKTYFKVPVPKGAKISPLMFFPQIPTANGAMRTDDITVNGEKRIVLNAMRPGTGVTRMEIDSKSYRVRRIVQSSAIGMATSTTTLTVDKEVFDETIADSAFRYNVPRGFSETEAPVGTDALFGISKAATKAGDKGAAPTGDGAK